MTHKAADLGEADRALKTRQRAMWAAGDYPAVAREIVAELGPALVSFAGISPGDSVLDVGAGTGNAAIAAARAGAEVVASDLTPELFDAGRDEATRIGVTLDWQTADAEALPFADGDFDVVMSSIGVMFAPHHQLAADELVRVTKPGGTIALASWTPEGFIGQLFATMRPYSPPPPPGAQPPPLWGDAAHVRELFGDRVGDFRTEKRMLRVTHCDSPESFKDYFKANYGPTIAVYNFLADRPDQVESLDNALVELGRRYGLDNGTVDWEYLLLSGRRAG